MDGEHRFGDPTRPAARTRPRRPAGPGPEADASHAYPGPFEGRRDGSAAGGPGFAGHPGSPGGPGFPAEPARFAADPAATQYHPAPRPAPHGGDPAATQMYGGPFGQDAGAPGGPGRSSGAAFAGRGGSDTVAFQGAVAAGHPDLGPDGARSTDYSPRPGAGYDGMGGYQGRDGLDLGGPSPSPGPGGYGPGPGGPHGQDQFGPGGPRTGGGGPSRRVVFTSLGVAALLAVGAGTVYSMRGTSGVNTASPTTTSEASSSGTTGASPTASATTPSVTVTVTTTASSTKAGGAPNGYVADPGANPDMDFGTIVAIKKQGGGAQITVRRQRFLSGDAAREYYDEHPDKEELDYAITDAGGKNKQYTVADDALIYGSNLLGDSPTSHNQLTVAEFVTKANALLAKDTPLRMWMYRRSSSSSTVTYLAEQYTP